MEPRDIINDNDGSRFRSAEGRWYLGQKQCGRRRQVQQFRKLTAPRVNSNEGNIARFRIVVGRRHQESAATRAIEIRVRSAGGTQSSNKCNGN